MICGLCEEDGATELAVLGDRTIAIHPECYDTQASMYAKFPGIVMPISR